MKKLILSLTLVICLIGALGFTACANLNLNNNTSKVAPVATSNALAFSAVSSATLLEDVVGAEAGTEVTAPQEQEIDERIVAIDQSIDFVENSISSPITMTQEPSDRAEYAVMLKIAFSNISGKALNYTLYFNEVEKVDNKEDDDNDDFKIDIDSEQEFSIEGILTDGTNEFKVVGEKELDGEESELSFKAYLDELNYVVIKQEIEKDENEFIFALYENGVLVSAFSVESEEENGETSIELKSKDAISNQTIKFEKSVENGKTFIKASINENGVVISYKVAIATNADGNTFYTYHLPSGEKIELIK